MHPWYEEPTRHNVLMDRPWDPIAIDEVVRRFATFDVDWWIAGGRAIDLFLGWETRPHEDIDLEMFRTDRDVLFDVFSGWDLHVVSAGQLVPWHRGDELAPSVFGVWGRPSVGQPWAVEVMLADGGADGWRFRRDPTITMPRERLTLTTPDGIRYCTPEVQLLYKSKQARAKDDVDFIRTLHRLDHRQRIWLRDAVAITSPEHPWVAALDHAAE